MLKNYLVIALRNILRHKTYSFINIIGLAVGMAACLLILLYVEHELSYDRFHEKSDRIYRIVQTIARTSEEKQLTTIMSPLLGPLAEDEIPEVETAVRFQPYDGVILSREAVDSGGERLRFYEDNFLYADSTFFDVFSFRLQKGDSQQVLAKPYSLVLTESLAQKYFGQEDPIGKTLTFRPYRQGESYLFNVTGIVEDVPANSTIQFNFWPHFPHCTPLVSRRGSLKGGGMLLPIQHICFWPQVHPRIQQSDRSQAW